MDKLRLPLALSLSFLVLMGWAALFGPKPDPSSAPTAADGSAQDGATEPGDPGAAEPEPDEATAEGAQSSSAPVDDLERWSEWIRLGDPGQVPHYWARFDNQGAQLRELRIDGFYIVGGLDPAEQAERDNWVPLLQSTRTKDWDRADQRERETGSFLLETSTSAAELVDRPLADVRWEHELIQEGETIIGVRFRRASSAGIELTKTFEIIPGSYQIALDIAVKNTGTSEFGERQFLLRTAETMPASSTDTFYIEPGAVLGYLDGDKVDVREEKRKDRASRDLLGSLASATDKIEYVGVHNKYFAVLMRAADQDSQRALLSAGWRRLYDRDLHESDISNEAVWTGITSDVDLRLVVPREEGESSSVSFKVYAGPKSRGDLTAATPAYDQLIYKDLGFFSGIANFLLGVLAFFHGITGNWGWSIILLTLAVRLALFPINRRSQTSMARHQTKMKRIQPKLDEAKAKYENDPTKLRQAQARIMQEEGALPPLGGCLPIFAQIPIFFGLFSALRTTFDTRQAPFAAWIQDLSLPDRLFYLGEVNLFFTTIEYLNVLPPLMVVLWIFQQKVMPKPTDEKALQMQKMMMWMPIIFGVFLYKYPAGLSLYMITTSTFGILEQTVIKKLWPLDETERPKKKSGLMAKLAELSEQAQKMQEQQKRVQGKRGAGGKRR